MRILLSLILLIWISSFGVIKILYYYDQDLAEIAGEFFQRFQDVFEDISVEDAYRSFQMRKMLEGELGKFIDNPMEFVGRLQSQNIWKDYDAIMILTRGRVMGNEADLMVFNLFDKGRSYSYRIKNLEDLRDEDFSTILIYNFLYNRTYYIARRSNEGFRIYAFPNIAFYEILIYDEESGEEILGKPMIVEVDPGPGERVLGWGSIYRLLEGAREPEKVVLLYRPLNAVSRELMYSKFPLDLAALSSRISVDIRSGRLLIASPQPVRLTLFKEGRPIKEFKMPKKRFALDLAEYGYREGELVGLGMCSGDCGEMVLLSVKAHVCPKPTIHTEIPVIGDEVAVKAPGYDSAYLEFGGKRFSGKMSGGKFTFRIGVLRSPTRARLLFSSRTGCSLEYELKLTPGEVETGLKCKRMDLEGEFRYLACRSGRPSYVVVKSSGMLKEVTVLKDLESGRDVEQGIEMDGFKQSNGYEAFYSKSLAGGGYSITVYRNGRKLYRVRGEGVLRDFCVSPSGELAVSYSLRSEDFFEVFSPSGESTYRIRTLDFGGLDCSSGVRYIVGNRLCTVRKKQLFIISMGYEASCRAMGSGTLVRVYELGRSRRIAIVMDKSLSYTLKLFEGWQPIKSWTFYGSFADAAFDRNFGYIFGKSSFMVLDLSTGSRYYNDELGVNLMGRKFAGMFTEDIGGGSIRVYSIYTSEGEIYIYTFENGGLEGNPMILEGELVDSIECGGKRIIVCKQEGGYGWLEF